MKRLLSIFCLCVLSCLLWAELPQAFDYFNGKTDKDPLTYELGETIRFQLHFGEYGKEIPEGTVIEWWSKGDDGVSRQGTLKWDADAPAVVETSLNANGFVWFHAALKDEEGHPLKNSKDAPVVLDCGAAVHPELLQGLEEPADFDEFWSAQKARLAEVPLRYTMNVVKQGEGYDIYAVSVDCAGPRPVTGFLSLPRDAAEKSLPACCSFRGYGYNKEQFTKIPGWHDTSRIIFEINAHGADLLKDDAYYEEFGNSIRTKEYSYAFNPEENMFPETAYFNGMVLRVLRALEFVKSLPQWDGKTLLAQGGSQGGLQTIWAAALDHDVSQANPSIPWCCDMAGKEYFGRVTGGWRIQYVGGLAYYDCINMGKRILCPVNITRAGLGDYTCPPSGVAILYNNLKCPKKISWYQGSTHGFVPKKPEIFVREGK